MFWAAGKTRRVRQSNTKMKKITKTERKILKEHGFVFNGNTVPKGYEKWYNPDGSRILIRPDGGITRSLPNSAGPGYRPRIDFTGRRLKQSEHNTGENLIN